MLLSSRNHGNHEDSNSQRISSAAHSDHSEDDDGVQEGQVSATLTDREKFRLIKPIMTNIAYLVALHSTNQFLEYVDEFKKLENLVRNQPISDASEVLATTILQPHIGEQSVCTTTTSTYKQHKMYPLSTQIT